MSVKLRPYPQYRDSGVAWLGNVPSHWTLCRIKNICTPVDCRNSERDGILLALTRSHGLVPQADLHIGPAATDDLSNYRVCRPGQLVMNRMQAWSGMFAAARIHGLVSPDYSVFALRNRANVEYCESLFRTPTYVHEFARRSRGIGSGFNRLYTEDFGAIAIALPPRDEQGQIARFVEYNTCKINAIIRTKRRQIELLNEQKRVIISRAVTRGLDSNVRLKPSGLDWLGDIPYHWEPTRLKYVADVQTGVTLGKKYGDTPLETRPYLRVANVQDGHLELADIATVSVSQSEVDGCGLRNGDVLMTEGGDIDKLGRGCIWRNEIPGCLHQNHIFAVRARRAVLLPEYLVLAMSSVHGRSYFEMTAKQTTNLASTNSTTLKALPLFLPGMQEQTNIVGYAAEQTSGLEAAVQRILTEVDLLHEYRTRLIADVVTGKLDVRGVGLPDLEDADIDDLGDSDFNSDTDQDDLPDAEEVEADAED